MSTDLRVFHNDHCRITRMTYESPLLLVIYSPPAYSSMMSRGNDLSLVLHRPIPFTIVDCLPNACPVADGQP